MTLRCESQVLTVDELAAIVGSQPTRARRHENPLFVPPGADPTVPVNVALFASEPHDGEDLDEHERSLLPLLEHLAKHKPQLKAVDVDVSLGIRGRDMGNLYVIDQSFLDAMSRAGASLVIDA